MDVLDREEEQDLEVKGWPYEYTDEALVGYEVLTWPYVQDLMDKEGFRENSYLINDTEEDRYGPYAFL